ncbi:MAG: helix-turn-helix domain-containing protein [Oligoflexales bacterium]
MTSNWRISSELMKRPINNGEAQVYRVFDNEKEWGILIDERIRGKTLFKPSTHSHAEWDEAIIPLDGIYWVKIGSWERKFAPGEAALIPGGVTHDSGIATNLAGTWFLVLLLHKSLGITMGAEGGGVQLPSGSLSWLKGAFRYLRMEPNIDGFLPLSILPSFIDSIAKRPRLSRENSHPDPIVSEAIQLLEQPEPPQLTQMAQGFGLTPSHFQKRFSQAVGCSPLQYSIAWRLDKIAELLQKQEERPLVDLAVEFGFGDMKHFRNLFKLRFGRTPGTYRKNPPP